MSAIRDEVVSQFQAEHREVRDTLLALSDAIEDDDLERARELATEANEHAGPHFQYEEDALYPALVEFFGEEKVKELIEEHDEAIESTRRLAELTDKDSLSEGEKEEALQQLPPLLVHVSDCDGLTVYLERMDDEVFEDIKASMETAHEEGHTLLEYAEDVRPSPDEIVA